MFLQSGNPRDTCEDKVCEVDNGVKFNPFYVREMRRPSANSRSTVRKTSSHRIDMDDEGKCMICELSLNLSVLRTVLKPG